MVRRNEKWCNRLRDEYVVVKRSRSLNNYEIECWCLSLSEKRTDCTIVLTYRGLCEVVNCSLIASKLSRMFARFLSVRPRSFVMVARTARTRRVMTMRIELAMIMVCVSQLVQTISGNTDRTIYDQQHSREGATQLTRMPEHSRMISSRFRQVKFLGV